jgi:NTP pyrophosphatase (non-canonical NTP hydrolase)
MGQLRDLQTQVWENMHAKGFDTVDPKKKIRRIIGELRELEAALDKDPDNVGEESADVLIETLGLHSILGVDAETAVQAKIVKNRRRRYTRVDGKVVKEEGYYE